MADNTAPLRSKSKSSIRRLVKRVSSMTLGLRPGKRNSNPKHTSEQQLEAAPEPVQSPCVKSTPVPKSHSVKDNAASVLENGCDQVQEGLTDRENESCQSQPLAEVEVQQPLVEVDENDAGGAGSAERRVLPKPSMLSG